MCLKPQFKGFIIGTKPDGKKDIKVVPYSVDHLELVGNDYIYCYTKKVIHKWKCKTDYFDIPCGHCLECQAKASKQWADRCLLEMKYHNTCYFLTLTYDDEHLPPGSPVNPDLHSLSKRDFQLFMKRLRKDQRNKLMYFMCGEYGDSTHRPHYHAIIYDLEIPEDDLILAGKSHSGYDVHISPYLEKIWTKGRVTCDVANWNTVVYTARYVTKKLYGDDSKYYEAAELLPPFTLCSKRPAIGKQWFIDNPDYLYDFAYLPLPDGNGSSVKVYANKYFDKLMDSYNPTKLASEKIRRVKILKDKQKIIMLTTDSKSDTINSNRLYHSNRTKSVHRGF